MTVTMRDAALAAVAALLGDDKPQSYDAAREGAVFRHALARAKEAREYGPEEQASLEKNVGPATASPFIAAKLALSETALRNVSPTEGGVGDEAGAEQREVPPSASPLLDEATSFLLEKSPIESPVEGRASQPTGGQMPTLHIDAVATYLPIAVEQAFLAPHGAAAPATDSVLVPSSRPVAATVSSPVKMIAFKLEPENFGSINVRMRLSDANVEIEIEASTPDAVAALREAKDALSAGFHRSGFALEALDVTHIPALSSLEPRRDAPDSFWPPLPRDTLERDGGREQPSRRKGRRDDANPHAQTPAVRDAPSRPRMGLLL